MLAVSDPIKKQLVRIKFVLEFGLAPHLARDSDADNVIAIILLDYCVESLLKTARMAAAVSPAKGGDPKFTELWTLIDEQVVKQSSFGISMGQLPFRVELNNLHRQRNSTQHESKTPHRSDVEKDAAIVGEFARQIYAQIFGLDYDSVTLVDLVRNEKIRNLLLEAQTLHGAQKYLESVAKSAEALTRMLRVANESGPKADLRLYDLGRGVEDRRVSDSFDKIGEALKDTNERMDGLMHIVMGLDFKGYARYRHYAPVVHIMMAGNANYSYINRNEMPPEESKFILDYVLANILRMEEYGLEWHTLGE